jgi:hypothetical protein
MSRKNRPEADEALGRPRGWIEIPMNQEDYAALPIEHLARLLMECAKQDPALVGRLRPITAAGQTVLHKGDPQALARRSLPDDLVQGIDLQLEELTSVAIEAAEQADEALRVARAATRSARLGMAVFASIGVLGIVVGVMGTADSGHRGTTQREINAGGHARQDDLAKWTTSAPNDSAAPARQADIAQDAAIRSVDTMVAIAPTEVPSSIFAPPVYHGPSGHAPPWQAYRPPARRTTADGTRAPATARVAVTFRHDQTSLFQPFDR